MLVIAPLSAFEAWEDEASSDNGSFSLGPVLQRFEGEPIESGSEVVLVNYQRLSGAYDELVATYDPQAAID